MKQNYIYKKILLLFMFILPVFCTWSLSQDTKKSNKKEKTITITATIVDEQGNPVPNASIIANEGTINSKSSLDGTFSIQALENSIILIESMKHEDYILDLTKSKDIEKIVLKSALIYTSSRDEISLPLGISENRRNLVGAVSIAKGSDFEPYSDVIFSNSLQGKLSGLDVVMKTGGLANNPPDLYIRGLPRNGSNGIVTIVDGMERDFIQDLLPEEVESMVVLKDPTTKILYGARAANGVLLIKTKRGKAYKKVANITAEYGVGIASKFPEFLNSFDYATLYNEARVNDGLEPLYSDDDLAGYQNSTGENDFRYPNVDYYQYFLNKRNNYRSVNAEYSGGNENAQYSLIVGYKGTSALQKIGDLPTMERFNVRGNLDFKVNDVITANIGIGGKFEKNERSTLDHAQTFDLISKVRPNEYPLIIDSSIVPLDSSGLNAFGISKERTTNLYSALLYGGFNDENYIFGQTDLGLNFDFNEHVKGLTAKAILSFDNYFFGREVRELSQRKYLQDWITLPDGSDSLILTQQSVTEKKNVDNLDNSAVRRATSWSGNVSYVNTFGDHGLQLNAGAVFFKREQTGTTQDNKSSNYVFRANYSLKDKYIAEFDFAYMGSNRFSKDNRYKGFYAGGLAWILSDEDFVKSSIGDIVDFLKFKASAGVLGYDRATDPFLYDYRWQDDGTYRLNRNTTAEKIKLNNVGNTNLDWETSTEFNIGLDGLALDNKLYFDVNYFYENRKNIIQDVDAQYSGIYGNYYPQINWGEVSNTGFEFDIEYNSVSGNLSYTLGANIIYSKNKVIVANEVSHPDENIRQEGQSSDAMYGLESVGLFGKDVDLAGYHLQTYGPYGNGDIAYIDQNGDNVVDNRDKVVLGNSFPRTRLGVDINLNYKGIGLYVLGTAHLGVYSWLDNTYYWNKGENKYSILANDSYHEIRNPWGEYPKLTTTDGENNYQNNDIWIEKSSFFRLKNVELSYTYNSKNLNAVTKKIKVFVRANNVFVISKIKDLDPEAINAGISNYPVLKNNTVGVTFSF